MGIDNVADVSRRAQYVASAAQTVFPYTFPIFDEDDLVVEVDGAAQTITTDYTVSGVEEDAGGNVTFTSGMTGGEIVTIFSETSIARTSDFTQNGPNLSTVMNDELDRITVVQQELREGLGRAIRFPMSSSGGAGDSLLSPISAWLERYLFINSDGELEAAAVIDSGTTLTQSVIGGLLYPQTDNEVSASVAPDNLAHQTLDIRRYGAVGNGIANDSVAIQKAVDVAAISGGTVIFPDDQGYVWGIGSQITVSSLFPVNLVGCMTCNPNVTENASYIKPLNNISGDIIRYVSPTADLAAGGGGIISGLSFFDDSARDEVLLADRRNFTVNAALGLDSFSTAKVENCYFHYIKGSAIRAKFAVMSDFTGLVIRYCGTTGKPAFDHPSGASNVLQSCVISNGRFEVNFDAAYIYIHGNTNTQSNKIIGCGFEAETTEATSSQRYIDINADHNQVALCHVNRLGATYAIRLSGSQNAIVDVSSDTLAGGFAELTGSKNRIEGGNAVAATSTIPTIVLSGDDCRVSGTKLYFANKIALSGMRAKVLGVEMAECTSADSLITASAAGFDISHVTISHPGGGRAVAPSGISVTSEGKVAFCRLTGNTAATGINVGSATVDCSHNAFTGGYTNNIVPNGHMADSIIERNISFVTENSGTTTVAAGATTMVVSHGLSFTPSSQMIHAWPLTTWGATTKWWVSTVTATQFTINVDIAPGGGGMDFAWRASPR